MIQGRSGIVVLDNNCYARLEDPRSLTRFRANLRAADLVACPSEVNLLEAIAAPSVVQARLLGVMRDILRENPLLPWPFELLKQIGEASLAGRPILQIDYSGKEWYLVDPAAAVEKRAEADAFMRDLETAYSEFHADRRKKFQAEIKRRGWTVSPRDTREFLETEWRAGDVREQFALFAWRQLGLPGDPPVQELLRNPAWSLMLDAEGVAVYGRAVAPLQPKKVHRADLIQLVYLAGADRRIIATADEAFLEAATAVLSGHPNARAVHIDVLLE